MSPNEIIDPAAIDVLLDAVGGDQDFLTELIDTFFEDTPEQMAAIRLGLDTGDAAEVRRAAHSIKSNSANFGAVQLNKLSKAMEDAGAQGDLKTAATLLPEIDVAYEEARLSLVSYRVEG
jgi:HPt (histidine-containing phosphotransfer) domain-containing protein